MSERRAVAVQWPAVEEGGKTVPLDGGHSEVKEGLEF